MLSAFPTLLSWSGIAPVLMRLVLGIIFLHWTYRVWRKGSTTSSDKLISFVEGVAAILLVIGLWTQVAALVIAIDLLIRISHKISKKAFLTDGINYYLILLAIAASLLFTGAGFLAFDYPL